MRAVLWGDGGGHLALDTPIIIIQKSFLVEEKSLLTKND
jgi:hypothetical protein